MTRTEKAVIDAAATIAAQAGTGVTPTLPDPGKVVEFGARMSRYLKGRRARRLALNSEAVSDTFHPSADPSALLVAYERAALEVVTTNAPPSTKSVAETLYDLSDEYTRAEARTVARAVLDGYGNDKSPRAVAKVLKEQLGIDDAQAMVLAQTELTRVAAADVLSSHGATGGKKIRFVNGADPCPVCQRLNGRVYTLKKAQNVIPVHPHCSCKWEAVDEPGLNVFCPTGEGGGVDPTCSPRGGAGGNGDGRNLLEQSDEMPFDRFPVPTVFYRGTESGVKGSEFRDSAEGGELGVGLYVTPLRELAATYGGGPKASVKAGTRTVHELHLKGVLYPEDVGYLSGGLGAQNNSSREAVLHSGSGIELWRGEWQAKTSQRQNVTEMNEIARSLGIKLIVGLEDSVARNQIAILDKSVIEKR